MNDPGAFGLREGGGAAAAPGAGRAAANSLAQYKFSSDEMRVLQECNRESFFQRSLPLSTLFGFGTYAAVQQGRLKPNPRFGAFPKVTLAVAVGYFLGKLSYQQACAEKLMALPGSYIGQLLRDRRDGKIEGTSLDGGGGGGGGSLMGAASGDIYSDAGPGSALDLDTDRPAFAPDTYSPGHDAAPSGAAEQTPSSPSLSYDELRRQNRGEFSHNKQDPYRVEPARRGPAPPPATGPAPARPHTNRYGDALD